MISRREALIGAFSFANSAALAGVQTLARHQPNSWSIAQNNAVSNYYDVVIYGGTVAGIGAARAAVMMGARTLLIEPTPYIGGASGPGGLTQSDCRWRDHTGGTWWQYMQRMAYREALATRFMPTTQFPSSVIGSPTFYQPIMGLMAERDTWRALYEFAFASGADILCNGPLTTFGGSVLPATKVDGNRIVSIDTNVGIIQGKVFIDASYEGDLLAGCAAVGMARYTIGREANDGSESYAGYIPSLPINANGASLLDNNGNPLYPLQFAPKLPAGSADSRVQSMTFRVPMGKASVSNVIPFYPPDNYDPTKFILVSNFVKAFNLTKLGDICSLVALNAGQYATNDGGTSPYGVAPWNIGADYGNATPSRRAAIVDEIRHYQQGLYYFALTDSSLPASMNADAALYGYLTENYTFNNYFPTQPYIREGIRMVNDNVLKQADMLKGATKPHSIGYATYVIDIHSCGAYATADGTSFQFDGSFLENVNYGPSQIPMEALFPRASECQNLLVPVCAATSHVAWGPYRLEPTFMIAGDACGIMAASMAIRDKGSSGLDYANDVVPGLTAIAAQF